ncbi:DUF58 domain-containing protein [Limisphaera ngatamarikiensis]|uniref:DUF58 domain-containing protein n=1 Tax=Limisphaera ngatamarikiensis TaxID=1324935 RepID=A0A6M1RGV3_9BACT|nr:DUF58 domain-containing protein [Limisphaera ngatamarikiensis]NGO39278.1 DUF58 domain-containing protein [Limisphaera ngatamarikiensis]
MKPEIRQALRDGERKGSAYRLEWPPLGPSGAMGARLGRRVGTSIDFQDYREYQPGDDLRFVDWNVYARTDRMAIKLFREEVTPHLDLLIDGSRSMDLEGTVKGAAVAYLAGALAVAAGRSLCTRAVWLSGEGFQRLRNDVWSPSIWDGLEFESVRTPEEALEGLPPRLQRLGMRVFLSDLLWPGEPAHVVRRLVTGGAGLVVVQILTREELDPPARGGVRLTDSETGEALDLHVDHEVVRQYRSALARWQETWAGTCRACGAWLTTVVAEEVLEGRLGLDRLGLLVPG